MSHLAPHTKSEAPLFLYYKKTCPFSQKALKSLSNSGLKSAVETYDVSDMLIFKHWTNQNTVPQLYAHKDGVWVLVGDSDAVVDFSHKFATWTGAG